MGKVDAGFLEKREDRDGVTGGSVVGLVVGYKTGDVLVREGGHYRYFVAVILVMMLFVPLWSE